MQQYSIDSINNFLNELRKWNESRKVITMINVNSHNITISFGKYSFIITCPVSENDSYIVQAVGRSHNWLDDVNIYCLEKKPVPSRLLNVISNQVTKIKDSEVMIELGDPINIDRDLGFDLEKYKKTKDLEAMITTSKSIIDSQQKCNQLFSQGSVGKIIVSEFIKLWDQTRNNQASFKIDIMDNNIYKWKLEFHSFTNKDLNESLKDLKTKFGYDYIEADIYFHDLLYPNYPPIVKILRPRLFNSLMHKIANTKMIQLTYWTPTRTMSFIINKLYQLLDKHAKIDIKTELNDANKYNNGSLLPIETHLLNLASFVDINEDDIDEENYEKSFVKRTVPSSLNSHSSSTVWAQGTGFGHNGLSKWDITAYLKSLEERDKQAESILSKITFEIQDTQRREIYDTVQDSVLIKYIKSKLNETTLLEMRNHMSLYQIIFNLLSNLANEQAIFLFDKLSDNNEEKTLYDIMTELNSLSTSAYKKYTTNIQNSENEPDELIGIIMNLYSMIKPCYESYIEQNKIIQKQKEEEKIRQNSEKDTYVKLMTSFRDLDEDHKIIGTNYYYQELFNASKNLRLTSQVLKRINDEISTFRSLPITYDAIIIARTDINYQVAVRTLITGPVDTPYEAGCFLFDTYLHSSFPAKPPSVWFLNTGSKRMNPNLYPDGKICLSILGTWQGDKGAETWNPSISSLIQVYKSIQSQILVEQPFYNEPGHESHFKNSKGLQESENYNQNIRLYTMKHAMYDLINNPRLYPQFEDVIRSHFKLKKEKILAVCEKWTNKAFDALKADYQMTFDQIKNALNKF